jgi:hypothetical protein
MRKPVYDVCGVNDCFVYIMRPEGTFCASCNEKIDQIVESTAITAGMKKSLIEDLKQIPNERG